MFLSLTFYAMNTESDITMEGGAMAVCGGIMLAAGIMLMFTENTIAHIIYSCLAVILFSVYIVYDTQLLLDNK